MTKIIKDHWPAIVATLGTVLPFLIPSLQAYASAHPNSTIGILCGVIVIAYLKQSPIKKGQ